MCTIQEEVKGWFCDLAKGTVKTIGTKQFSTILTVSKLRLGCRLQYRWYGSNRTDDDYE
jgi:hypothetical protein